MNGQKITLEDLKYITQGLCRIGIGLQDAKIEFIGKEFVLKDELKKSNYIKFNANRLQSIKIEFNDREPNIIKFELD